MDAGLFKQYLDNEIFNHLKRFRDDLNSLLMEFVLQGDFLFFVQTDLELFEEIKGDIAFNEKLLAQADFPDEGLEFDTDKAREKLDTLDSVIKTNKENGFIRVYIRLWPQGLGIMPNVVTSILSLINDKYPNIQTVSVEDNIDMDQTGVYPKKYITLHFYKN